MPNIVGRGEVDRTSLWQYYWSEEITKAIPRWSAERCVQFMEDPATISLDVESNYGKDYILITLNGKCHDDRTTIKYRVTRKELTMTQKKRVMKVLKEIYTPEKGNTSWRARKNAASALGVPNLA